VQPRIIAVSKTSVFETPCRETLNPCEPALHASQFTSQKKIPKCRYFGDFATLFGKSGLFNKTAPDEAF
jgi:hypothetical protein